MCVSGSFVEKLWQRWRSSGSSAAKPHAGGRQGALTDHLELLRTEGAKHPDATLAELRDRIVAAQGPRVSPATSCRALPCLRLPRKKSPSTPRRGPPSASRRAAFPETGQVLDVHRLQFVDAAGATLAMIRRYGRATPGQRVVDHVPDNYGPNQTMVAALGLHGLEAPWGVAYTSYKVANLPIEFSTSIPRTQLRPGYGDGFLGAPLQSVPPRESASPQVQGGQRGASRTHRQHPPGGAHHV